MVKLLFQTVVAKHVKFETVYLHLPIDSKISNI